MTEPLWSKERIAASLVALADEEGAVTADDIMHLIYGICDEYEAELARVQAAAYAQVLDEHEATLARARVRRGSAPGLLVGGEGA